MARIMYTVSMVLSFMRMLRMGYIVQALGPRIMSIGKLVSQIKYTKIIKLSLNTFLDVVTQFTFHAFPRSAYSTDL